MPRRAGPRAWTVLARGVRRRCPRCGGGGLFTSYLTIREACPGCALPTERGEGFWLGAMAINLGLTELIFGAGLVGSILATWPDVPWTWLLIGGVALNALLPVVFYPFAKSIFLGIDMLMFRMDPMRHQPASPYDDAAEAPPPSPA